MVQKVKVKNSDAQSRQTVVLLAAVAAIVVLVGAIAVFFFSSDAAIDYSSIPQNRTADGGFILGNPEAAITIVAWEDFLCPHCQAYQSTVKDFIRQFVATGQARFEFRMLPISNSSGSVFGLVECAEEVQPGSFWTAHDVMFNITSTSRFGSESGREFASRLDIPYSALLECVGTADQFRTDQTLAQQYGEYVTGTPAVGWRLNGGDVRFDFINRQPSVSEMAALITTFGNQ